MLRLSQIPRHQVGEGMMITVIRMDDGSWISWGRHSGCIYRGEDAKVLDMLFGQNIYNYVYVLSVKQLNIPPEQC